MSTFWLKPKELKNEGVPISLTTIWRKQREHKFPRHTKFGRKVKAWPKAVIDTYNKAMAAGCSEKKATRLAEKYAATLLDQKSEEKKQTEA
jgi:hypothetical protein